MKYTYMPEIVVDINYFIDKNQQIIDGLNEIVDCWRKYHEGEYRRPETGTSEASRIASEICVQAVLMQAKFKKIKEDNEKSRRSNEE